MEGWRKPWKRNRLPPPESVEEAKCEPSPIQSIIKSKSNGCITFGFIGLVILAGIAVAVFLGDGNAAMQLTGSKIVNKVDNAEPSDSATMSPEKEDMDEVEFAKEVPSYEGSLTTQYIAEKFDCATFSDALELDPEEVAEYISDWMYDNGYEHRVGADEVIYGDSVEDRIIRISGTDYTVDDNLSGSMQIESVKHSDLFYIVISDQPFGYNSLLEYYTQEIPNYETLLHIAQEYLG